MLWRWLPSRSGGGFVSGRRWASSGVYKRSGHEGGGGAFEHGQGAGGVLFDAARRTPADLPPNDEAREAGGLAGAAEVREELPV